MKLFCGVERRTLSILRISGNFPKSTPTRLSNSNKKTRSSREVGGVSRGSGLIWFGERSPPLPQTVDFSTIQRNCQNRQVVNRRLASKSPIELTEQSPLSFRRLSFLPVGASYWSPEHSWGGLLQNPYTSIRCQLLHCRNLFPPLQRLAGNGNLKMA